MKMFGQYLRLHDKKGPSSGLLGLEGISLRETIEQGTGAKEAQCPVKRQSREVLQPWVLGSLPFLPPSLRLFVLPLYFWGFSPGEHKDVSKLSGLV